MKRKWNVIFIIIVMLSLTSCGNVKKEEDNTAESAGSIFTGTGIVREADRKPEIQETGKIETQTQEDSQKDEEEAANTATPTP